MTENTDQENIILSKKHHEDLALYKIYPMRTIIQTQFESEEKYLDHAKWRAFTRLVR